jgi:acyl-CoA synthetase (AMP-forming)/AMP-acid ligase II
LVRPIVDGEASMTSEPQTLPGVVRAAAERFDGLDAVVDGEVTLTFTGLLDAVRDTARGYLALGLEPGERVALWAPNSWQWEVAALAVSYAGGTLVPLNTRYTGHEAADVIRRTHARFVVLADGFLGRRQYDELVAAAADDGQEGSPVPGLPDTTDILRIRYPASPDVFLGGVTDFDVLPLLGAEVSAEDAEERADTVSPDDVADILFTSGTTGVSKGACSAHRQTVAVAQVWGELGELTPEDRYLVVNPFFHSFGYKAGIVAALLFGATVVPQPVFDVKRMLDLVAQQRITVLPGAPAIYHSMLESPYLADSDLSSLRLAVTGAAVVPVALVERMQSELSFDSVLTAFGMTECVVATMCRIGDDAALVANSCGPVVPGLELRIARPGASEELPPGEEGELLLRGDTVMLGYLDDPEATAETVDADGWLHTGDIGRVDEQGYLKVTDRLKDMYICGGFNVYPAEVEQTLARLDGVVESAVVGVPDERLGEVGKAFVVVRDGAGLTPDDVVAFARERLANFKVPREVELVDVLPRNLAGKVLKRDLRSR